MSQSTDCGAGSCLHRGHVVFGYSDTGGGHRSAADAVAEALLELRPELGVRFVDMLADYAPWPFNVAPQFYRHAVHAPVVWWLFYQLGAGKRRAQLFSAVHAPVARSASARALAANPADLYVSFHPGINTPLRRSLRSGSGPARPLVTVVTDLTTMSALWFDPKIDLCIVPTTEARALALRMGVPDAAVRLRGMPVRQRFRRPDATGLPARRRSLGWDADLPTILVTGGGEGVGPIREVTAALAALGLPLTLAVVAGHNARLRRSLTERRWPVPVHIYGFVDRLDRLMAASDMVVTKAGPSAMYEAFSVGVPVVLCHRVMGQERGNVGYAVRAGAALWAPTPPLVAAAVRQWLDQPEARLAAAERGRRLARPSAPDEIARDLLAVLDKTSVPARYDSAEDSTR